MSLHLHAHLKFPLRALETLSVTVRGPVSSSLSNEGLLRVLPCALQAHLAAAYLCLPQQVHPEETWHRF